MCKLITSSLKNSILFIQLVKMAKEKNNLFSDCSVDAEKNAERRLCLAFGRAQRSGRIKQDGCGDKNNRKHRAQPCQSARNRTAANPVTGIHKADKCGSSYDGRHNIAEVHRAGKGISEIETDKGSHQEQPYAK